MTRLTLLAAFSFLATGCLLSLPADKCGAGGISCDLGASCINGLCVADAGPLSSTSTSASLTDASATLSSSGTGTVRNASASSSTTDVSSTLSSSGTGTAGTTGTSATTNDASATIASTGPGAGTTGTSASPSAGTSSAGSNGPGNTGSTGTSANSGTTGTTGTTGTIGGAQCTSCEDVDCPSGYSCVSDPDGNLYCALTVAATGNVDCGTEQRWILPDYNFESSGASDAVCYPKSGYCEGGTSGGTFSAPECNPCAGDGGCTNQTGGSDYVCVLDATNGHPYCALGYFTEGMCDVGEVLALLPDFAVASDWVCYPPTMTCTNP